jgi:hypothetical protein
MASREWKGLIILSVAQTVRCEVTINNIYVDAQNVFIATKFSLKQNKTGYLKIKNYKFETDENFKYLGVTLN